jgi:hypothetical protein
VFVTSVTSSCVDWQIVTSSSKDIKASTHYSTGLLDPEDDVMSCYVMLLRDVMLYYAVLFNVMLRGVMLCYVTCYDVT